jgi:flagellar hook-associated protein 3 FlgL
MSGTIGTPGTGYGFTSRLIANSTNLHRQLNALTEQASSGRVADTFAGLGTASNVSLDLNPQLSALNAYHDNIDRVSGTMQVTQAAMTQLQQIAAKFAADIPNLNGLNPSEIDNIAADARDDLVQMANILNTRNGSVYVFAGEDTSNPPVPSGDNILTSGFYTQINTAVSALASNGADATAAATLAIAGSNDDGTSPFSTYLSQPASALSAPVVRTGESTTTRIGLLASANSTATSGGTSTTGSYMRDLMRALATIGSMSSSQLGDPGFGTLVRDTGTSLDGVVTAMATDVGAFGIAQSNLTQTQTFLTSTATALTGQISNVQDADMAVTLSRLTAMQTQLQESYKLITTANSLSLINFLPNT